MMLDMKVSSAEFRKKFDVLSDKALTEPVTITRNGRDWLVLLSIEEYERLKSRDRQVAGLHDEGAAFTTDTPAEYGDVRGQHKPDGLGTRLARRFAGRGLDFDIPEIREEPARPASFDE